MDRMQIEGRDDSALAFCTIKTVRFGDKAYRPIGSGMLCILQLLFQFVTNINVYDATAKMNKNGELRTRLKETRFYCFVYASRAFHLELTQELPNKSVEALFAIRPVIKEAATEVNEKLHEVWKRLRTSSNSPLLLSDALSWVGELAALQKDMTMGNSKIANMPQVRGTAWMLFLSILHSYLGVKTRKEEGTFVKTVVRCTRAYIAILLQVYNLPSDNYLKRMLTDGATPYKLEALQAASITNHGIFCRSLFLTSGEHEYAMETNEWGQYIDTFPNWPEFTATWHGFYVPCLHSGLDFNGLLLSLAVAWCSISDAECNRMFRDTLHGNGIEHSGDRPPWNGCTSEHGWPSLTGRDEFIRASLNTIGYHLGTYLAFKLAFSEAYFTICHLFMSASGVSDSFRALTLLSEIPAGADTLPKTVASLREFLGDDRKKSRSIGEPLKDALPYFRSEDFLGQQRDGLWKALFSGVGFDERWWIAWSSEPFVSKLSQEVCKRYSLGIKSEVARLRKDRFCATMQCLFRNWVYQCYQCTDYLLMKVRELMYHKGLRFAIKLLAQVLGEKFQFQLLSAIDRGNEERGVTECVVGVTQWVCCLTGMIKDERLHTDGFSNECVVNHLIDMLLQIAFFLKDATVKLVNEPRLYQLMTIKEEGIAGNQRAPQCLTPLLLHLGVCLQELVSSINELNIGGRSTKVLDNFMQVWYFLVLANPCLSATFFEEAKQRLSEVALSQRPTDGLKKRKFAKHTKDEIDDVVKREQQRCTDMSTSHRESYPFDASVRLDKLDAAIVSAAQKVLGAGSGSWKNSMNAFVAKVMALEDYLCEEARRVRHLFARLAEICLVQVGVLKLVFLQSSRGRVGACLSEDCNEQQFDIHKMTWYRDAVRALHNQNFCALRIACETRENDEGNGEENEEGDANDAKDTRDKICNWLRHKELLGKDQTIYDVFMGRAEASVDLNDSAKQARLKVEVAAYLESVVEERLGR